jgi:hypothetical protein
MIHAHQKSPFGGLRGLLFVPIFFAACVFYPIDEHPGTIMFTATHDCDIRLFDSDSVQIAREHYEVGKKPAIVYMKSSGEFTVHAVGYGFDPSLYPDPKPYIQPLTYKNGILEYYIEF